MAWLPAKNATIVINSIAYHIVEAQYMETYGEFDATAITGASNPSGALAAQFDTDVVETTFNGKFIVDSAAVHKLLANRFYTVSYTSADGDVHTGQWKCIRRGKNISSRGRYEVDCSGKYSGLVSGQ